MRNLKSDLSREGTRINMRTRSLECGRRLGRLQLLVWLSAEQH